MEEVRQSKSLLRKRIPSLRTHAIINTLALNLISPFISFYSASTGIGGELLAIVTSAGITLPGLAQFILSFIKSRAKTLLFFGTLIMAISWFVIGLLNIIGPLFVLLYIITEASLGIANLGWMLIIERISVTKRGSTLALYSFYGSIGGLFATLITGIIVRANLELMRYFFLSSALILFLDVYIIHKFDVDAYYQKVKIKYDLFYLKRFLLVNFIFTIIWAMAWPLFPLAQIYKFHMTELEIGILAVIGTSSTLLLQRIIGRLTDKRRKHIMFLGRFLLATFPLAYVFSTNVYELYIANLISGLTNSAGVSYTAYLFDNSNNKKFSIALYNFINGLAALIGSSIGSLLLLTLEPIDGIEKAVIDLLFLIGILRICTSFMYLTISDSKK